MTEASKTYKLIEPFLKKDMASLYQKGKSKGQDTEDILILLFDVSKEVIFDYSFSSAGLVAAIAASAAGDLIMIPAGTLTLTAGFTLKADTTLKGAGVYATFITSTIAVGDNTLVSLSEDSCIEDMTITYISAATYLMTLVANNKNQIIRRVNAYHYTTKAAAAYAFHTGTNTEFKQIDNCIFVCDGNGGERVGMYASTIGSPCFIRNTYGYGHNNTASVNAYGISVRVTIGGPIIMQGCYGYGYAQNNSTIGWGIYTEGTVESYSCHGYGRTGTAYAVGFEVNASAKAYSCYGEALNDGGGTTTAWINNAGYMFACNGDAYTGTRYGLTVWGIAYAIGCRFNGATADIILQAGCNLHVYACQYDTTTGTGTITKDAGDLSIGTGTDNRITQWNGTGGLLEDSKLIGPTVGILSLVCAAAGAGATVDFGLAEGVTLTINASTGTKTIDVIANGNVVVGAGGEVNKIPIFDAASHLVDLDNAAGLLQNDGLGNLGSITWSALLNSSLPNPWALMASTEKQLSGGEVTVDKSYHTLKAETGTDDDLDTINGGTDRQFLLLMAKTGHTITVKHNTGNIFLNGLADFVLTGTKKLLLFYDEVNTKWGNVDAGGGGGGSVATDAIWDAKGDLAGGTGADTAARLPVGADGQVLTANSGAATGLAWAAAGSGDMANDALWDAKGDIAGGTGVNTGARLAVGANGKRLVAASGETTGLKWDYDALYVGQTGFLTNEIMNFPSLEKANDTQPEWWECTGTLTEVDVAGEGITETFERALKYVTSDPGQYALQTYTYADQQRIKAGRKLSAIAAVWCVSAAEATISLVSNVGVLGTSSATTAAAWTILTVEDVTLDGASVYLKLDITGNGTAYFVPLGVNIGSKALALPPRCSSYRRASGTAVLAFSGDDGYAMADLDLTASSSALANRFELHVEMYEGTAGEEYSFHTRPNGSSLATDKTTKRAGVRGGDAKLAMAQFSETSDDGQIIETALVRDTGAGTIQVGNLYLDGYYEWE